MSRYRISNAFYRHIDFTSFRNTLRVTMHIYYRAPQFSHVALRIGTTLRVRPFDRSGLPATLTFRARLHASLQRVRDRRHTIVNCFCGFTFRDGAKEVGTGGESQGTETAPSIGWQWDGVKIEGGGRRRMESLGDAPLLVVKREGKKRRDRRKDPSFARVARARTSTLWLSGEGDQKVESRSVRKGATGRRQFTDVRRNWFRGDRNYFFRKSRFSPSFPSISLAIRSHTEGFWFFSSRCDSPPGYRILPVCSESLVRSRYSIGNCAETEVTFSNFSPLYIEWERQNFIPRLVAPVCLVIIACHYR